MEWEEMMETVKALALAVAIGFPLLVLLSMLMGFLIRTVQVEKAATAELQFAGCFLARRSEGFQVA
jgi:hypothetical protein